LSIKTTTTVGSVRVDLLGGTLDLSPIHLILPNVVTLNVATSLQAQVKLTETTRDGVEIISEDYKTTNFFASADFTLEKLRANFFGPLTFVAYLLLEAKSTKHLSIELKSGSPAGAGLGGSSAMGVVLMKALLDYQGEAFEKTQLIQKVHAYESIILNAGPAGYQDYYPAVFGGVLALKPAAGKISVEQLFNAKLKQHLESQITLVYSGETRLSGMNNWEVYKDFFDQVGPVRAGLTEIARLSFEAYQAIQRGEYGNLIEMIKLEGEARRQLFPGIVSESMKLYYNELKKLLPKAGMKVCGAGGGGTFLVLHEADERGRVQALVEKQGMKVLPFEIVEPLEE